MTLSLEGGKLISVSAMSASVQDAISAKVMHLVLLFFFLKLFTYGLPFSNGSIVTFITSSASST